MAEYIEREAAVAELEKQWVQLLEEEKSDYRAGVFLGRNIVKYRIPAADVVEVRHGQWVIRPDGPYGQNRCYCTACGKRNGIGGKRQKKPYCPNCGAKMDGGADNAAD